MRLDRSYLMRKLVLAHFATLICSCGHSESEPSKATSRTPVTHTLDSKSIVRLTPRCAERLREIIRGDARRSTLYVSVIVEANCQGFRYDMKLDEPKQAEGFLFTTSEGITLGIDRDDAEFLNGITLDYLESPGGFTFNHPHPDTSLLSEYRRLKEAEDRRRPMEASKANEIDPPKAVAELSTPRRQEAFEDLQLWWKFNQPEVRNSPKEVGRVDRYQLEDGDWITVVFTGAPEEQRGGVCLIKADGRQIPIFHGNNYLGDDDQFIDVNGDGVPELVSTATMGGKDEDNPNRIVTDATAIDIIPITPKQIPLLRIVFDVRPVKSPSNWRWKLVKNATGTTDVVVEKIDKGNWTEKARFVWSLKNNKYEGPLGSRREGFIANSGDLETDEIVQFMKRP